MDNEGKNLGSIRLLDGQTTALPQKVKENLYVLETTQGIAYLNGDGTVLHTVMDGTLTRFGEILLGSRGIYDLELNEIYNFRANHASVLGKVDDTVFVWQENGEAHDVLSFRGGKQTTVCGTADGSSFKLLPSMKLYVISNAENTEHRYYSIDGTHLLTTDVALSFVCAGGGAYMMWNANEEAPVYYCFS